jgi:hypothetical protein
MVKNGEGSRSSDILLAASKGNIRFLSPANYLSKIFQIGFIHYIYNTYVKTHYISVT